jgi:hypothetical protein
LARQRRQRSEISLFPFLSVLACIIGTLILLLSAVAVGGIGERSLDEVRLSERFEAAEIFLAGGRALLEDYEAQLRLEEERAQESQELGRLLAGLGLDPDISLQDLQSLVDLEQQASVLKDERASLARKTRKAIEKARRRSEEIKKRRAERSRAPIIIEPSGVGPDYVPFFVECTRDYLEVHRTQDEYSYRIPATEVSRSADYKKFLRRLRAVSRGLLIFLIRPDGVETFSEAEAVAHRLKVRNAKLPLPGEGALDFDLMREARR